jgi:hypothetical protein
MTESGVMRTFESLESSELMTTVLWPSLLAGDHPKHLYPEYYESDSPFNVWMQGEWDVDALNTPPVQRLEGFTVRRLSSLFDRKRQEQIRGRVREVIGKKSYVEMGLDSTISLLDVASAPKLLSFPGVNFDISNMVLKTMVDNSTKTNFDVVESTQAFEMEAMQADIDRLVRTLYTIHRRENDVIMAHFFSLDLVQHVWANSDEKMERWYGFYDFIAKQVIESCTEEDTVIIVSDHGMEQDGIHSKRAFYAASKELWDADSYRSEDLADVLIDELRSSQHLPDENGYVQNLELETEAEEHLKDLGYF